MNDKSIEDFMQDNAPRKKEWVVQKFPIKGGGLIRSAMQTELFFRAVQWATVEGKIRS